MSRTGFSVLGVALLLAASPVQARDDMSGVWEEDYDETIISVEQWGPHCGEAPRSTGRRSRGLSYLVEDRGVDLYFKAIKKGRSFSTAACHSTNKRLKPKERKLKDKLFLVNCATSESSQSYESGLYSFRIKSIAKIEYRETSRFSRNIKGALCVHTRRVRRVYTHIIGKKPPVVAKPPEKKPEPVLGTKLGSGRDPCETPGKPARLQFAAKRAELLPGGKVWPKFKAFDSRGCETQAALSWGKGVPPKGIKLDIRGCLKATPAARPGKKTVKLAAGPAQASLTLVVKPRVAKKTVPTEPQEPAAKEPEPEPEPEPDAGPPETAAAPVVKPDAGPAMPEPAAAPEDAAEVAPPTEAKAEAGEEPGPAWVVPVAIGGGLLLLALVLFLLLRKRSRPTGEAPAAQSAVPAGAVPPLTGPVEMAAPVPAKQSPAPLAQTEEGPAPTAPSPPTVPDPRPTTSTDQVAKAFCTTCGKSIPAEAKFCPYDRTPIYRPGSPTLASAPVCPTCKRLLPMGAKFCPYDRTKLV